MKDVQCSVINDDGLCIPSHWEEGLDVLFDGRRIWSVLPSRHRTDADGYRRPPWPHRLTPFLHGYARVTVQAHQQGRILADREHQFGSHTGRVRVVDEEGNPLAVDKWGFLGRPFGTQDPGAAEPLLNLTDKAIHVLEEEFGLPAFVAFGTLLGAVRDGRLIGHDNDIDIAYLSNSRHPLDAITEVFRVGREMRRRGWHVVDRSGGFVTILCRQADNTLRNIDIFTFFYVDDILYGTDTICAKIPASAILPLAEIELEGRTFPAPAEPARLLEAGYGPGWSVPDPFFQYKLPPATRRRFRGWLGETFPKRSGLWEPFYRSGTSSAVPSTPSVFATWVSGQESARSVVVDVGTGTARDAIWFGHEGHRVIGLDYARPALGQARARAAEESLSLDFERLNLYSLRQVLAAGARLARIPERKILYGRFVLHALEDDGRCNFWRLAQMALGNGGRLYLEFRTHLDEGSYHEFGEHFRHYLDPEMIMDEIDSRGGGIVDRQEGYGLAPLRQEDPHMCRLVAEWRESP